ncbi:MAG: glycosyltransferase family 8 protein, partial [Flavobacterium sp.]
MRDNTITIVLVCNDHFAILLATLIKSLTYNHSSEELLSIYIVNDKISLRTQTKIIDFFKDEHLDINWLSMSDVIDRNIDLPSDSSTFPSNVYVRLFIPMFLPKTIKKAIYLDVDMIVCTDISLLWNIDLGEYPVAAVRDRSQTVSSKWGGITNYKELGLAPETPYFNSGLLILNLDIWRSDNITSKIITSINSNIKYAKIPDQYGINIVLANKIMELDYKWNCYPHLAEKNPN